MNHLLPSRLPRATLVETIAKIMLGFLLAADATTCVHAQGQIPGGTVSGNGSGPYTYNLTFSDAAGATSPIGSVWYAWVPGSFYLPNTPASASAPVGWTATIFANSIQYAANSAGNDITAGSSLSGFGFHATFSPATLAATPNSGVSVAYSSGNFSGVGGTFTVSPVSAPEPSAAALVLVGGIVCRLAVRRQQRMVEG